MIITSNVNSKRLYDLKGRNTDNEEKVIHNSAQAYFNGRLHTILDVLNLNSILADTLLLDVALVKVGPSII